MIPLFLEPLDVWLFRDGRPFDAGAQHRAESLFPPSGSVIAGAIRSFQLVRKGVDLNVDTKAKQQAILDCVGTADDLKDLRLTGPFVARRDPSTGQITRYYPQPADAISTDRKNHRIRPASAPEKPPEGLITSRSAFWKDEYLMGLNDPPEKGESGLWLAEGELVHYLEGQEVIAAQAKDLFEREVHPGIGIENSTKTTRNGMLYEVEFIRPLPGVGLWVGIDGDSYLDWPESAVLKIGGESRAAACTRLDLKNGQPNAFSNPPRQEVLKDKRRVYLATPARFSAGWQPVGGWGELVSSGAVLRAAALNRFTSYGGFDLTKPDNGHKAARRYVPAGSVYYFESSEGGPVTFKQPVFTEFDQAFGLGAMITGGW